LGKIHKANVKGISKMSVLQWLLLFLLSSIFYGWVLLGNGAKWLEGWQSWWLIGWFSLDWTAEQIRLYVLIIWIVETIWFVVGLFQPSLRTF